MAANPILQSTATGTGTTTANVAAPAGIVDGELIVMYLNISGGGGPSISGFTDTGFGGVTPGYTGGFFWKKASGEPSSYNITGGGSGVDIVVVTMRISGQHPTSPINAGASGTVSLGNPVVVTGGITPSVGNTLLLFGLGGQQVRTFTSVSIANNNPTWTNAGNTGQNSDDARVQWGNYTPTTTTGNATGTFSGSGNFGAVIIAIAPDPAISISVGDDIALSENSPTPFIFSSSGILRQNFQNRNRPRLFGPGDPR